ncbi:MAG: TRAP transporter small permease [Desulfovibrio sp.]|jgi:TRAP-type C4-dicarboxylate transport system permease small subunit|nr:TRAP transporter small permease [Desulfovibrio sp.]
MTVLPRRDAALPHPGQGKFKGPPDMKKNGILHHLDRWEEYLLFVVMIFMLIVLSAQVFCRYFLSFSFSWAEQGARIGFVWLTMVGISLAAKHGMHLKVDLLTQILPKPFAKGVSVFSEIFTMAFGAYMGSLIFRTVMLQIKTHQTFSAIPWLPTYTMYAAGVVGMFGLTLRTLQRVFLTRAGLPEQGRDTTD